MQMPERMEGYDYEVFLSFRGPDTRTGITDHLYCHLTDVGIRTFRDDEQLRNGEEIGPDLLGVIEQSKISIPIFSKNYASSKWCLDELARMVDCSKSNGQKIMPLFYHVKPSEVQYQTGGYGEALLAHENQKRFNHDKIQKWKKALNEVGGLNGWMIENEANRHEGQLVKDIVTRVLSELKRAYLVVSDFLVGVDDSVKEVLGMIGTNTDDVKILGIHGMGGIGKTTLAKIVYNKLCGNFDTCCFLADVRETSREKGIGFLQAQLISYLSKKAHPIINSMDEGIRTIEERFSGKKVLILLDDVDEKSVLIALLGRQSCFGPGSRILITTRNAIVLTAPGVDFTYLVHGLDPDRSLQLFSRHAFRRDYPPNEKIEQSREIVKLAQGLPLALEVMGSALSFRTGELWWDEYLAKWEKFGILEITSKLMISYEALDTNEREIFLDIACLFDGYDKSTVVYMWRDCDLYPTEGLDVLQLMALIKIGEDNKLCMHKQLKDLGKEIVFQESAGQLERQNRLWNREDALDLLRRKKINENLEALCLMLKDLSEYRLALEGFPALPNLKFLQVELDSGRSSQATRIWQNKSLISNKLTNLFVRGNQLLPNLRWLSWHNFPRGMPNISNFSLSNLVVLDVSRSQITHDWNGWRHIKRAAKLKVLNLSECVLLTRTPDFSGFLMLERLILEGCERLAKIDSSVGQLKRLVSLNVKFCRNLRYLPKELGGLPDLTEVLLDGTELMGPLQVATDCASNLPQRLPSMSEVRRMIEDQQSQPPADQIIEPKNDLSRSKRNLPDGGVLEVSDRVYVFEYCLTSDWLKDDEYERHLGGIVAKLQDQFPAASFMVLNFGEQENQSPMATVLSEYDITVMDVPQNYGGYPVPRMEIIHSFLTSADEWLSSDTKQNVLLMHCERGSWPVLAFMLASLLLYRKEDDGERRTLNMIYNKAPHELLQLTSTLNPFPSQLRYLHYLSTENADSGWHPTDKALVIESVKLSCLPHLDDEGGRHLIVQIMGWDPFVVADQTPKVLFSTPNKQAEGETVKLDIHCNVQGDVVLECMNLDADLEHGESMFRAMFNTAFISDNVLKLEYDDMDVLWDHQDEYPKEFMAEIVFSLADAATSLVMVDLSSDGEEKENRMQKSTRKINPEEMPAEGRAEHSITPSYDANASPEENAVPELPVRSNSESYSTLPPSTPSPSETSVHSAFEGSFGSFESATKSTCVEGNGENTESKIWEGIAAVTETNMVVTSASDSASSSAVNNGGVAAIATGLSNSTQFPDMLMPKQEKLYQQDDSPSSTSASSGHDYDVFLSFRGPDTRTGITNFLYTRLLGARIHTFKDDEELRVGEEFGPELLKAISQSKIAIPIFSKGYASSKWCLKELVQMVECSKTRRQNIMPIFYDVTPAEVRHQMGSYEKAFLSHEEKFSTNVSEWKAALNHVANLNGWDNSKKNRGEGELVDEIVQKVINELKTAYLLVTDCLVGIENHVKEIDAMMCCDSKDIRILGIHGMGGVGKTTLAKIIYNRLSHHFEDCCFLSNISETSKLKGIEGLQNQLISDLLKKQWSNISNFEEGIKMIKERLRGKTVLVLLDDVDEMTHWDALIGQPAWFGLGSRIIITSRNRDIVEVPEICYPYELISMNFNQSLQLFSKHAFGRDYPLDDYVAFSIEVVKTTGGLPLALEAIGKLLPHRSKDVWDVILKKLKQVPLNEVKRKLKTSYYALDDGHKHIFLDIACLFTGFDQKIVLQLWKDSDLFPEEGLEVLQKKSLIKIGEDNKLWMHDQLRGLGRHIVHLECDKEHEKRTRLWNREEVLDMVMETKATKKVEALCRKFDPQSLYYFVNEEVERPSDIRYPEVRGFQKNWSSNDFPANLQNNMLMLSKMRWLSWHYFPLEVKITNFSMMNIVILHLVDCPNLIDVQRIEALASLRILKLIKIPLLERLPDLSNLKKLNELHLGHCHNLIEVQSIEGLGNLTTLKLIEIQLLKRLPDLSNLKKLTELHLRYCHRLTEIKSFEGLENLMILKLGELSLLERLPNLSNLKKLTQLDIRRCHNLAKIQGRLESLEDLCIEECRSLDEVLDPASSFKKLKSLRIRDCEKLHLDRIWVSKFNISDRVYGNSTCRLLSKIGICVCMLGRKFFLPSLP